MNILIVAYASSWFIFSLFSYIAYAALPSIMAKLNVPPELIGLTFLLFLPVVLAPMYAGIVEKYRVKGSKYCKNIINICLALIALCFIISSSLQPESHMIYIILLFFFMTLFYSILSIAITGSAADILDERDNKKANALRSFVSGIGGLFGSMVFLLLVDSIGWVAANFVCAAIVIVFCIPVSLCSFPTKESPQISLISAFKDKHVLYAFMFLFLSVIGERFVYGMLNPFLAQLAQFSLTEIGIFNGIGHCLVLSVSAPVAYFLMKKFSNRSIYLWSLLIEGIIIAIFAIIASEAFIPPPEAKNIIFAAFIIFAFCVDVKYTSIFVQILKIAQGEQSGLNASFISSSQGWNFIIVGIISGWLVGIFSGFLDFNGYFWLFSIAFICNCITCIYMYYKESLFFAPKVANT